MKVSDQGIFALALHEGIVPAPYLDSVGVWTFGIGHTASAGAPDPATLARGNPADLDAALAHAFAVFRHDLAKFEKRVNDAVKVPLRQHEFDALVSFDFNTGGIGRAQLTRHLNNGDRKAAAAAFMGWVKPPEIRGRREAERRLFEFGTYPSGTIAAYAVTAGNKPDFRRVLRKLSQAQVLAALQAAGAPASKTSQPAGGKTGLIALLLRLIGRTKD
jgi:lysozyme